MAKRKPVDENAPCTVRLKSGAEIELDGDLVFLIDALFREYAVKRAFAPAFGEVQLELEAILDQMTAKTAREYFVHSLFLNYVTYENEMAARFADRITSKAKSRVKDTKAQK